jgi:hypothetical protein
LYGIFRPPQPRCGGFFYLKPDDLGGTASIHKQRESYKKATAMNRNQIIILLAIALFKAFLGLQQPTSETNKNIEQTKIQAYSGMQTVDPNRFRVSIDTLAQGNNRREHHSNEFLQQH